MYFIQTNSNDKSTNDVLDWMFFLGIEKEKIGRLNDNIYISDLTFKLSNGEGESININKKNIECEKIRSFWYRRGMFSYAKPSPGYNNVEQQLTALKLGNNFEQEQKLINNSLYFALNKKNSINTYNENFTNKITNLSSAARSGLHIPDVLVTNDIAELMSFSSRHKKIITKDIFMNPVKVSYDKDYEVAISAGVQVLEEEDVIKLSQKHENLEITAIALYQKYIEKKYELRIFYLKGKFFPMAIFSQANEKTKIDFRNYDDEKPNRCVPYQLPQDIEKKLDHFMKSIDINSGSVDMIYTPEGEYVFLEVNPIGQFQWVARNCNYDIERQIALELISEKNE